MKKSIVFGGLTTIALGGWLYSGYIDKSETRKVVQIPSENLEEDKEYLNIGKKEENLELVLIGKDTEKQTNAEDSKNLDVLDKETERKLNDLGVTILDARELENLSVEITPTLDPNLAETDDGLYYIFTNGNIADVLEALKNINEVPSDDYLQYLIDGDLSQAFIELIKAGMWDKAASIGEALGIDDYNIWALNKAEYTNPEDISLDREILDRRIDEEDIKHIRFQRATFFHELDDQYPELKSTIEKDFENYDVQNLSYFLTGMKKEDPLFDSLKSNIERAIEEEDRVKELAENYPNIGYKKLLSKKNFLRVAKERIDYLFSGDHMVAKDFVASQLAEVLEELEGSDYSEAQNIIDYAVSKIPHFIDELIENHEYLQFSYRDIVKKDVLGRYVSIEHKRKIAKAEIGSLRSYIRRKNKEKKLFERAFTIPRTYYQIIEAYLLVDQRAQAQEVVEEMYELPDVLYGLSSSGDLPEIVNAEFPELAQEIASRHEAIQGEFERQLIAEDKGEK